MARSVCDEKDAFVSDNNNVSAHEGNLAAADARVNPAAQENIASALAFDYGMVDVVRCACSSPAHVSIDPAARENGMDARKNATRTTRRRRK
jgi:hypothetical protein